MGGSIEIQGDPPVSVAMRWSNRARRVSLRVSMLDGRAIVTAPADATHFEVEAFVRGKADWLRSQVARRMERAEVTPGGLLPVEGRRLPVVAGARPRLLSDRVEVPAARAGPAALGLLKPLARDKLVAASDRHAAALGLSYSRITLRDPRSRWGSCSRDRKLMYSWRLILAPPEVLDYVAAHEVAHLKEMNHGPRFWALCERLCPEMRVWKSWLRNNSAELQRWWFG